MFSVLALVAIAHANLAADLTGRTPTASGMTQIGRDLLRKCFGEVAGLRPVTKRRNTIAI
jgi:hypothetical protein